MSNMSEIAIQAQEEARDHSAVLEIVPRGEIKYTRCTLTDNENYWLLCLIVVDAAGTLAGRDKLIMNYRNPRKRHNVADIVHNKKYYKKGIRSVKSARTEDIMNFWNAVDDVNWVAREKLDPVGAMTLMGMLEDAKERDKFRRHIRKHIETDHPTFELDEVPNRDFRKTRG